MQARRCRHAAHRANMDNLAFETEAKIAMADSVDMLHRLSHFVTALERFNREKRGEGAAQHC